MNQTIESAQQVLERVNEELSSSANMSQQALLDYLCTQVRTVPKTSEESLRFFYVLGHLSAIIGPERFQFLRDLLKELKAPEAIDFIVESARSVYNLNLGSPVTRLTDSNLLIQQLEIPGLESGWRILASISEGLRLLGCAVPTLDGLSDIPTYNPAFFNSVSALNRPSTNPKALEQIMLTSSEETSGKSDFLSQLIRKGLWKEGAPLRLHLGCGESLFENYINVDYPPVEHNVMQVKADIFADITAIALPRGCADEVRLHHVFEHFSRVTALAMLVKWHAWLKVGGKLHIVTPDLMGSAHNLLTSSSWKVKMGSVRHLTGDQAANWAYHVEQWFPERFERTLKALGFEQVRINQTRWNHEPHLCDVEAIATKTRDLSASELLKSAEALLWESTVAPEEEPTYRVWCSQLRTLLAGNAATAIGNTTLKPAASSQTSTNSANQIPATSEAPRSHLPLHEILDFNQLARDAWVTQKAQSLAPGSRVLDIGAGTCPYKHLFSHCDYKTHDFKQYEGVKLGGTTEYGHIDYVSDINAIPVPDASFDAILCTEVFEHVPEPIAALKEIARIVKPGGRVFITAPLGSGLHQLPFHFYGGYTPQWYKHFCTQFGLSTVEITPNGGFFKHLAQECARAGRTISDYALLKDQSKEMCNFLADTLPRIFYELDGQCFNEAFTVGYFVEAQKPGGMKNSTTNATPQVTSANLEECVNTALNLVDKKMFKEALEFVDKALQVAPGHTGLLQLKKELKMLL